MDPNAPSPTCVTLWIGPSLGRVERACLRSAMRQGHPVALYCYDEVAGVPDGVEVRDAAQILPRELIAGRPVSPALFANHFRYRLLAQGLGVWIDADVYCLAPLARDEETLLFGWQSEGRINNAVLRLPPDSPVLTPLLELMDEQTPPAWASPEEQAAMRERLSRTGRIGLEQGPWGIAGPLAVTATAQAFGLAGAAQPRDVFYPVHWRFATWLRKPGIRLDHFCTDRTRAAHLWNEIIKPFKDQPAEKGSFLARLQEEGA